MNVKKIGDKALVVKVSRFFTFLVDFSFMPSQVDAKTKKIMDQYISERRKKNGDAKQLEGDEIEYEYDDKLAMDSSVSRFGKSCSS